MSASTSSGESSSSRASQDADAEQEPQQRRWVALVSKAVILADNGDERARAMRRGRNFRLDLHDPPLPSYLVLHPRRIVALDLAAGDFARQPSAYILAADNNSGRLLFRVAKPNLDPDPGINDPDELETMYVCRTHSRKATPLPAVSYSDLHIEPQPRRSIGLIADTHRGGYGPHYDLIVQLFPRPPSTILHTGDRLLCHYTAESRWFLKPLITTTAVRLRNLCGENGVLAHAGRLYWLALAYGIFFCDPFPNTSRLHFVPLPADCETWEEEELTKINRASIAQRRRVVLSEGHLRYVEIRGLSYDVPPDVAPPPLNLSVWMWKLVDAEGEEPWWTFDFELPFAEVWAHDSYDAAGLQREEVPHVALVDPDDHCVIYFLQSSKLFGVDVRTKVVVSCEDCSVHDDRRIKNSRPIIDAWKQSPPPPPSPSGGREGRLKPVLESFPRIEEGQTIRWCLPGSIAPLVSPGDQ